MSNLVERIRGACDGHPHAKIEWPHRILHEAADRIRELEAALREATRKPDMVTAEQAAIDVRREREAMANRGKTHPQPDGFINDYD